MTERLERSWLKDALDRALADDDRPTAVQQFVHLIKNPEKIPENRIGDPGKIGV